MLIKTRGIVLRCIKYGESSLITDLFTESNGIMSFVVKLSKNKSSRYKRSIFQPLTIVSFDCDLNQRYKLQYLKEIHIENPFMSIPFSPYKITISIFLSEFLYNVLKNEQTNDILFQYLINSIKWLDGVNDNYSNFHLVFLMRMSRFLGFYPNIDDYRPNCIFDLRNASFCQSVPLHNDFLNSEESAKIEILMRMNYETMHLYTMSRNERNRCIEVILNYYRLHIPDFQEMKSLSVLTEIFT